MQPPTGPYVNGVRVDVPDMGGFLTAVHSFKDCGKAHVVHFLPAHPTVIARHDEGYRRILNRGDANLPDGAAVAWATKLQGASPTRITGTDAMSSVTNAGRAWGLRHFLYGGTDQILGDLKRQLRTASDGVAIVGSEAPPFREATEQEMRGVADRVRESGADTLWIGLGTPKQDYVAERLRQLDAAQSILCVGAAFDFVSGSKKRAPVWMQKSGLEWIHRLFSDPKRLWRRYLVGNPQFLLGVITDAVRKGRTRG